jgi:hypothetical protein
MSEPPARTEMTCAATRSQITFNVVRHQPSLGFIECGVRCAVGHTCKPAIQIIGPRMIGADQILCATARTINQTRPAMAAHIGKGAQLGIGPAHHNHTFADIIECIPITCMGDIGNMAHDLPAWAENAFNFYSGKFGIVIGLCWKAPAFQQVIIGRG